MRAPGLDVGAHLDLDLLRERQDLFAAVEHDVGFAPISMRLRAPPMPARSTWTLLDDRARGLRLRIPEG